MAQGFAGGLADGLRNGMQMNYMMERMEDDRRARAKEDAQNDAALAAARLGGGLEQIGGQAPAVPSVFAAPGGDGNALALESLQAGAGDAAPATVAPASTGLAQIPDPMDQVREINRRFSTEYQGLLDKGDGIGAMSLRTAREKLIAPLREQAFGSALSSFQGTKDPKALVGYANDFGNLGFRLTDIVPVQDEAVSPLLGPSYRISGVHRDGTKFSDVVDNKTFNGFLAQASDPGYHKQAFVEQTRADVEFVNARRKALSEAGIKADAAVAEAERTAPIKQATARAEPFTLGANQKRYERDANGNLVVVAAGPARASEGGTGAGGAVDRRTAEPAEVRTMNHLMQTGVAKDATDAWNRVRGTREKSELDFALDYAKDLLRDQRDSFGTDKLTPAEALQQGRDLYRAARMPAGEAGAAAQPPAKQPARLAAPTAGHVEDGYRFKGGNPSDASNWEKAR